MTRKMHDKPVGLLSLYILVGISLNTEYGSNSTIQTAAAFGEVLKLLCLVTIAKL